MSTPIYGEPQPLPPAWDSSAISGDILSGNGWFRFQVPTSSKGVVAGLNEGPGDSGFADINFALQFSSGAVRVVENGVPITGYSSYADTDVFRIVRWDNVVVYVRDTGTGETDMPDLGITIKGSVLHTSATPITFNAVLDCSLLYALDSILDAGYYQAGKQTIAGFVETQDDGATVNSYGANGVMTMDGSSVGPNAVRNGSASGGFTLDGAARRYIASVRGELVMSGGGTGVPRQQGANGQMPLFAGNAGAGAHGAVAKGSLGMSGASASYGESYTFQFIQGHLPAPVGAAFGRVGNKTVGSMEMTGAAGKAYGEASGSLALTGNAVGSTTLLSWGAIVLPPLKTNASFYQTVLLSILEEAIAGDATAQCIGSVITDSITCHGTVDSQEYAVITESASLSDDLVAIRYVQTDVLELARLGDATRAVMRWVVDTTDTAEVSDTTTLSAPFSLVCETAFLADAATESVVRRADVLETARLRSQVPSASVLDVLESALVAESLTGYAESRTDVIETAWVTGALTENTKHRDALLDSAMLGDFASLTVHAASSVTERGYISGDIFSSGGTGDIWTANIQNWAMSRYTGVGFSSMTREFAAGADGLYVRGVESFEASFETGDMALGSDKKKRLEWIYMEGQRTKPMSVTVTGDVKGARTTSKYTQLARSATDIRVCKTQVGKGFHSNFYRIKHSSNAAFSASALEVVVAETERRI
jgi:hypothetical protein